MRKAILIILFVVAVMAILLSGVIEGLNTPPDGTGSDNQTDDAIPPEVIQYAKDWPLPNRDYNNSRATTDSNITSETIENLDLAWSYNITGLGTFGGGTSNPLILGDTVYFQDLRANVIALDRATGGVKWIHEYNASFVEGPNGPAIGWGKVFIARDAYSMAALNASSGEELWSIRISPVNTTGIDIAPSVYNNLVYTSTVPGTGDIFYAPGGIGVVYALDQETGAVVWNWSTVDSPDLWGHPEVNSGGGCWYSPAVDTETGILYWSVANPAPFPGTPEWPNGSSRPGPNLYTNSLAALNHSSGDLLWFTQVLPHDLFDYDLQMPPILASANISGKQQDIVISGGKMGQVYAFNRSTGSLLWQVAVGRHNGNDTLDALPSGVVTRTEPAAIGGVETPMAYADGVVYVPVINMVTDWTPEEFIFESFNISEGTGELVAIDVNFGKKLWVNDLPAINVGSAMVVNDLVFTATFDGTIYAFNRTTGEEVWRYFAPAHINGWPAVAGDTIVWPAGSGGQFNLRENQSPSLLAFRLSEAGPTPNVTPSLTILAPGDGATIAVNEVTMEVDVSNFNIVDELGGVNATGEGHLHYYMDAAVPTTPGEPALTPPGTYAPTTNTSYTWTGVSPGMHNFSVQLVNNDHSPLIPLVYGTVNVEVVAAGPTETPSPPTTTATTMPPAEENVTIDLLAQGVVFDTDVITVPAGAQVTINFNNQDPVPHNFAAYTSASATEAIFVGEIITGPAQITYTFTAPETPGTYFFRCDVHPTIMTGDLIVQ